MKPRATTRIRHKPVLWLALLGVPLLFGATKVMALPLSDYHQNIKQAIATLESMGEWDEDLPAEEIARQYDQSVNTIRSALPQKQTVEVNGEVYEVDNTWLHTALDELAKSDDSEQKRIEILDTLVALETSVAERENATQSQENKEQSRSRMESILARPEYTTKKREPNALTRLIQDIVKWLVGLLPKPRNIAPGRINLVSYIVQIVVLVLAALLIVYVAVQLIKRFSGRVRRVKKVEKREARIVLGERLESDVTAADLLSAAEALALQGDLRAAIRKAYIALLVELGDRKVISLAHHKTNRDYLNSLRSSPPLHARMKGMTESFERHWYGFVNVTQSDWSDFRANYLAALQSGN